MAHAPGFSTDDFGVAQPNSPLDGWLCQFTIGGFKWLSSEDMSSGLGGIECRHVHVDDYSGTPYLNPAVLTKVITWLRRLP